jgi:hypothetical protein
MSDIVLSYASEDWERVRPLIRALEQHGWSIWWDRSAILPGQAFEQVIEEALEAARCVLVVWSTASIASDWVKSEATEGRSRRILVPVTIDDIRIPLGFRQIQAARLGDEAGPLGEYAWYDKNSGGTTHPAGQKKPNAWGLYDMHGNVWEWVQDWSGAYSAAAVTEPQGPSSGSTRVFRGGGWSGGARYCRSAYRLDFAASYRLDYLGFRLLRTAP